MWENASSVTFWAARIASSSSGDLIIRMRRMTSFTFPFITNSTPGTFSFQAVNSDRVMYSLSTATRLTPWRLASSPICS